MAGVQELSPSALYRRCDPARFSFDTTSELPELQDVIGQPRAVAAVRFGIGIRRDGYNIFAMGQSGTGKHALVSHFVRERAVTEATPDDWCYVHNFEQPWRPRALRLPPGRGVMLRRDMEQLVREVRTALASAFESDEYRSRRQVIEHEFKEVQERSLVELQQTAQGKGLALLRTPGGLVFAPMRNNEVIPPDEYQKLPEEERQRLETDVQGLQEELQNILSQMPQAERQARERVAELNREFTNLAISTLFREFSTHYSDLPAVLDYINAVQRDIVEAAQDFVNPPAAREGEAPADQAGQAPVPVAPPLQRRYMVNVLVDNSSTSGAPMIHEDNPSYVNLVGRTEHLAQLGALITDFNLIKPGALHRANGGYLTIDVRKVLQQPYAWEGLKRALQTAQIVIESLGQVLNAISTITLDPEPIPLNVKVVLLGDRELYYMLAQADPDFDRLFKVIADFSEEMERDADTQARYAQLIATLGRREGLRPLDRGAVARTIEQSSRLVSDVEKLSARTATIRDLIREADYWAGEAGRDRITAEDVERAVDGQI